MTLSRLLVADAAIWLYERLLALTAGDRGASP